ncbi:MAG: hypothetical protein LBO65_03105 [Spirochaetaceae bacterium]|nr:hypothetical protein [Spirochaetaceae bacterium]
MGCIFVLAGEGSNKVLSLSLDNEAVRLGLGLVSVIVGILKVLSPVAGNVPVVGDLVPALANLLGGGILVFEFYRSHSTISSPAAERIGELVERNKRLAGFICIVVAVLHFIFYSILFL